jgi:hypothetical protein
MTKGRSAGVSNGLGVDVAFADQEQWLLRLEPQPRRLTAEEYEALPEEIAKAIEIVDGYVVYSEAPSLDNQTAMRRPANLLERHARAAVDRGHRCTAPTSACCRCL